MTAICTDCGGPGILWEDGFALCNDCAIIRAKRFQMVREGTIFEKYCERCGVYVRAMTREERFRKWGMHLRTFHYPDWGKDHDRPDEGKRT